MRGDISTAIEAEKKRRVRLGLGTDPIGNARYLLPPITLPLPAPPVLSAPDPHTEFIVDMTPALPPLSLDQVRAVFAPETRARLRFPRLWGKVGENRNAAAWKKLDEISGDDGDLLVSNVALAWELTSLLTEGAEAAREMAGWTNFANERAAFVGRTAQARESSAVAAERAARLNQLKTRFARAVEMRLVPIGRTFPARAVWRAAYALGMEWGEFDLFHWRDASQKQRLFILSSTGQPGYFLPERAAEGEGVTGIALAFELPHNSVPLETFDRMAVALSFLREQLGGRTVTREGAELDFDRLHSDRDALEAAVEEMRNAQIAPGSPQAQNFF